MIITDLKNSQTKLRMMVNGLGNHFSLSLLAVRLMLLPAAEYLSKKNSVGRVGWSSFSLKFSHGAKKTFIFVCSASTDY